MGKKNLKNHVTQKQNAKNGGYWKGGKKGAAEYEGKQYRGGRKEGRKNLTKLDNGNYLNQHGIEFTQSERKKLESLVNSANRKRKKMLDEEGKLPRYVQGEDTGQTVNELHLMGKESDFILSRKTKSLQRFKSREQFEAYVDNLTRVNSKDYIEKRVELYKENHTKALKNVFGEDAEDVIEMINNMSTKDYMKMVQSDEDLEIGYVYDPSQADARLKSIRRAIKKHIRK